MVIKASSARHIDNLLDDLANGSAVAREAAIARLIVIGGRAVNRLAALVLTTGAPLAARLGALRALEAIGGVGANDAALQATADADDRIATTAIDVARANLAGPQGIATLDRLTAIALDPTRHDEVRTAALKALRNLEPATLQPVLDALARDSSPPLRQAAIDLRTAARLDGAVETAWLEDPELAGLPDEPDAVRRHITDSGDALSLAALHRLVEAIRQRESAAGGERQRQWMGARAAAHVALARRGSRIAVYDLREALEGATEPLPVEFLAALTLIGDSSCLDPLLMAYSRTAPTGATPPDWWHRQLADAFHAIVAREGMTRRHAAARKLEKRWPKLLPLVWTGRGRPARRPVQ